MIHVTTTTPDERSREDAPARLPWWSYETAAESLDDIARVRDRVRARLAGQRGVRIVDLLLIIDVLLTDAFDSGFAQRDLRLTITTSDSRLLITLDAVDAPAAIGSTVTRSAGKALLDLVSTDWGVHRQHGRKTSWAAIDAPGPLALRVDA